MSSRAKKTDDSFGARIRSARLSKKITQKALGAMVNKGESTVRMWELGKSEPDLETLKLLARALEISIDGLLNGDNDGPLAPPLSPHEAKLVSAYRNRPELQAAVDRLLEIDDGEMICLYTAAKSQDNHADRVIYMRKEEWNRIKNAPETDDPLT